MSQSGRMGGGARMLLVAASFVVLVAGLRAASSVILPFLVALFVAMISLPLVNWLQARKVPTGAAVVLTLLTVILVLAVLATSVGGSVRGFSDAVPRYQERLGQMVATGVEWLGDRGVDVSTQAAMDLVNPGTALNVVTSTLRGAASVLSNILLVFLTIVFLLFEACDLPKKLESAFGRQAKSSERFDVIRREVQKYLGIKTLVSLATGLLVTVALAIIGVDFPILWGLLAFLLNYIPNIGSLLAAVPPVLLAIVQFGPGRALLVAVVFLAINFTMGSLIEPHFLGRGLGLSTLVVFLSLIFWGWVWGPVGMLLSVPLTMIVKIMLANTEDLRWVAVLLAPNPKQGKS